MILSARSISAGALLIIAATLGIVLFLGPTERELRVRTISMLNRSYVGILILENTHQMPVTQLMESRQLRSATELNHSLAMLLEEIDIYIAEKPGPLAALELVDAYGRAFICLPRAEAVQRGLPDALVGENRSVAIYSVGRNGKDENGRGDDIFWEEL